LTGFGHIGGSLFLAYVGSGIKSFKEPLFIIISFVTLIAGVLFVLHYKKVKKDNVS
jgi:positive regulator of sigma E activity